MKITSDMIHPDLRRGAMLQGKLLAARLALLLALKSVQQLARQLDGLLGAVNSYF